MLSTMCALLCAQVICVLYCVFYSHSGYGAVFFILGLTSGTLGKSAMDWVVQKRKQTSLIVFALSAYTVAAVVSMCALFIYFTLCFCV